MKREYFIAHWNKENERAIFRKDEDEEITQRLSSNMVWSRDKWYARKFLHKQDAESVLTIVKMKK